jgi:hypothetical protein
MNSRRISSSSSSCTSGRVLISTLLSVFVFAFLLFDLPLLATAQDSLIPSSEADSKLNLGLPDQQPTVTPGDDVIGVPTADDSATATDAVIRLDSLGNLLLSAPSGRDVVIQNNSVNALLATITAQASTIESLKSSSSALQSSIVLSQNNVHVQLSVMEAQAAQVDSQQVTLRVLTDFVIENVPICSMDVQNIDILTEGGAVFESFVLDDRTFLVAGNSIAPTSTIYVWNPLSLDFDFFQNISSTQVTDIKYFEIGTWP